MAKTYTRYVCRECGKVSAALLGRCPQCGAWDSMEEEVVSAAPATALTGNRRTAALSKPRPLTALDLDKEERLPLPIAEFARVLGGGIVPGSLVLIGGDPGIGKSTLMLQMALEVGTQAKVLYVSGEEAERQIGMRARRLLHAKSAAAAEQLLLVTETNLELILEHIEATKPHVVVIDSIQTVYMPQISTPAGSVTQVREGAARLRELAKNSGVAVFLVGHVTKEGMLAGPKVLEHIVDTVLYLEGDRYQSYRVLRCVKNRFGATSEVGVFEMQERGMVEVPNPSEAFLAERAVNTPGSAIAVAMEGTRPLLVEIQGLSSPSPFTNPRRTANGIDFNRLLLVTAVLTRRLGLRLSDQDLFVNVVGGMAIEEPAADLAVAAAIASSYQDQVISADTVLIGEVGLSAELRSVGQLSLRLREAANLGFKKAIIPYTRKRSEPMPKSIEIITARDLRQALAATLMERR